MNWNIQFGMFLPLHYNMVEKCSRLFIHATQDVILTALTFKHKNKLMQTQTVQYTEYQ